MSVYQFHTGTYVYKYNYKEERHLRLTGKHFIFNIRDVTGENTSIVFNFQSINRDEAKNVRNHLTVIIEYRSDFLK